MCDNRTVSGDQIQCDVIVLALAKLNRIIVVPTEGDIEEFEVLVKQHAVGGHRSK